VEVERKAKDGVARKRNPTISNDSKRIFNDGDAPDDNETDAKVVLQFGLN